MTSTSPDYIVWEVVSAGGYSICSPYMLLTEAEAKNKVDNEARMGHYMKAQSTGKKVSEWTAKR